MKDLWIVSNGVIYQAVEFNDLTLVAMSVNTHALKRMSYDHRYLYTTLAQAEYALQKNPNTHGRWAA